MPGAEGWQGVVQESRLQDTAGMETLTHAERVPQQPQSSRKIPNSTLRASFYDLNRKEASINLASPLLTMERRKGAQLPAIVLAPT